MTKNLKELQVFNSLKVDINKNILISMILIIIKKPMPDGKRFILNFE